MRSYEQDEHRSIDRFIKTMKENHGKDVGSHNLYLIRSYDRDGNITDEKFGINLMTDFGLAMIARFNSSNAFRLTCGNGAVTPAYTDESIGTDVFGTTPSITLSYEQYPITYDSVTDIIRMTYRFGSCEYDYNLSGVNADVEVTHFGIYYYDNSSVANRKLATHSLVYDDQGNVSSFTKHINEKLTITIFMAAVTHSRVISEAYNNGIYIALGRFRDLVYWSGSTVIRGIYENEAVRMSDVFIGTLNDSNYGPFVREEDAVDTTTHIRSTTRTRVSTGYDIVTLNTKHMTSLTFGWVDSMTVMCDVKLSQPEELSCDCIYTDSNTSGELRYAFGWPVRKTISQYNINLINTSWGFLPVNDFTITSSYMWDYSTKDWTIQEQFHNPATGKYVFEPFIKSLNDRDGGDNYTAWSSYNNQKNYQKFVTYDSNNAEIGVHIRINKHPDIPIKRFITDGTSMLVYGTDTYWDGSTYVPIPTYATDIPAAHRNYKYYLFTEDIAARVEYIYSDPDDIPHLIPTTQPYEIDLTGEMDDHPEKYATYTRALNLLASTTNGWIATAASVIYPHAQGGPVVHSLVPWDTAEPNYVQHKLKNVILVDVANNINLVTWESGYFDDTGTLVADQYRWYCNEYFDITGYQQLCWQATIDPGVGTGPAKGDRMVFYLYDENKDFIKCVDAVEKNGRYAASNGIYDNLPDNAVYFRFGYWRPYSTSAGTNSIDNIKYLSYCELYQFSPAYGKRFSTKDRLVFADGYANHGDEDGYGIDSDYMRNLNWNNQHQRLNTHTGCMIVKVGNDPTVAPEFQYIKFPFHVPYQGVCANIAYQFDEYTGLFVVSKWKKSIHNGDNVPNKVFGVDLYGVDAGTSDPFDNDAEMFYIGDGFGCNICKKYKWCAYFDASDYRVIHAYDLENRVEICTFTIDQTYTIDQNSDLYLLGNYIYIPCMLGNKNVVILCDISSERWEEVGTLTNQDMYTYSSKHYSEINSNWSDASDIKCRHLNPLAQGRMTMTFNDGDCMFFNVNYTGGGGWIQYKNILTTADPRNWFTPDIGMLRYLSRGYGSISPVYMMYENASGSTLCDYGFSKLILTDDGKHLLGVGYGFGYCGYSNYWIGRYMVFDVGMHLNNGQTYRCNTDTEPYLYPYNYQGDEPLENSVITYFDDGIIAYAPYKLKWTPLAYWLPHKVTGTTYTIQTYNNPKKISGGSITLNISNRIQQPPI